MAALKAFQSNYSDLVRLVSESVKYVADECRAALIIGSDTYEKVMQASRSSIQSDKARDLLQEICSRIEVQAKQGVCDPEKCVFAKFVRILKKEPSLKSIAEKLEETRADIERTSPNVDAVDSGVIGDRSASGFPRKQSTSMKKLRPLSESDASLNAPTAESSEGDQSQAPVLFVGGIGSGVSDLRAQISDLKATDAEKEATIKELEDKLETTTHEKNETELKLKAAEKRIDLLSKDSDKKIAELNSHIKELREKAASKEKEDAIMKKQHKQEISKLENELSTNKEMFNENKIKMMEEICNLNGKVKDYQIEEEKLKRKIEEAKRETAESQRKTAEAQRETAEVRQKLAEEQQQKLHGD